MLLNTAVESFSLDRKVVQCAGGMEIPYDVLVVATGSVAVMPDIPGIDLKGVFVLKNLVDALAIKAFLRDKQCRKAIIAGTGFIGLEMCEAFRTLGMEASALDLLPRPAIRWDEEFSERMLEVFEKNQVAFSPGTRIQSIRPGKKDHLQVVTDRGTMEGDIVLLALGVKPDIRLAQRMGLKIGNAGAIAVNSAQETSVEGIYAAGDCCESFHRVSRRWVYLPLGDVANKQGRIAGANIGGKARVFPGIVGAQSFKFFDLEIAATGLNEHEARDSGFDPVSITIWGNAIAPSMSTKKVGVKLIADRSNGRLLGGQAVGETGAVSRVNLLSAALWAGMHIDDLMYMDQAYSPPYSGVWDVVHVAAQALKRQL